MLIEIIKTIILGIVEGITEWLPISSTGHIILADEFLKLNASKSFLNVFSYVIQLGAIFAVILLYWPKLNPFFKMSKNNFKELKMAANIALKNSWYRLNGKTKRVRSTARFEHAMGQDKYNTWVLWLKVVVGVLPAVVAGLLFNDFMDEHLMTAQVVAVALIFYGIIFIVVENKQKNKEIKIDNLNDLTFKTAFLIGLFQVLSLVPGTSRSGATILGGLILGTSRFVATEFSFFLSIPVMFGVSILKIASHGLSFTMSEIIILLVGMLTSFIVSIAAIKLLIGYLKKHDFKFFGYYRIILGTIILIYFWMFK